ncbi:MAG: nitrilase-related carbon-nitrogen hydrolase [Actinomycetota bacterium]|nr:nitrilase-related carbon-nitrogen hydrolase [Actinomycetota bacterium]
MLVAAIQHDVVWEDPSANHARLKPLIAEAAAAEARLVVLTEMYATGFSLAADRIAEDATGPSVTFLSDQAVEHGLWITGSVPVRDRQDSLPVNRMVVAGPDGAAHHYDKLYPFTYAREHEQYRAGERSVTLDIEGVRTTLFVCYDLRFSEAFWDLAADTDLYLVVANWPESRRHHWRTLLRARAIENQAWVVGVNRVGEADGLTYIGDTVIVDPMGEPVAEAADGAEQVVIADVDPVRVSEVRATFPFLADRRH